ncbi:hypothetical protein [Rhodococcus sp. P1Y]|nr:hypothetical protein [Rhodococcus sp. P1Y]
MTMQDQSQSGSTVGDDGNDDTASQNYSTSSFLQMFLEARPPRAE